MKHFSTFFCSLGLLGLGTLASAQEVFVTLPSASGEATEVPFGIGAEQVPWESVRYQQIYDSRYLSGIRRHIIIRDMRIRSAQDSFGFSATVPEVEIRLSTSQATNDNLSPFFSENVGSDELIVYNRSPLFLHSGDGATAPDAQIVFHRPFVYHAAKGSLLLEIRNYRPITNAWHFTQTVGPLDAEDNFGDAVSRIYASNVTATVATGVDTIGLWTRFFVTVVPTLNVRIDGPLELTWAGTTNFFLQRSPALFPPAWADLPGTAGASSFTETNLTTSAYYRLAWSP
jgi:hypothetical protein